MSTVPARRARDRRAGRAGRGRVPAVRRRRRRARRRRRRRRSASAPDALRRDFGRVLGVSPKQYADGRRVDRLRAELRDGRDVTGALYTAGYGSSSRLYEQSDARLGHDAGVVRRGRGRRDDRVHGGAAARSARSIVATTERGVCWIALGAEATRSSRASGTSSRPPTAIERDDAALAPVVAEVLRRVDGELPREELPARRAGHRVPAPRVAGAASGSRAARRAATARWPPRSACPAALAPSVPRAGATRSPSWCPATASSPRRAGSAATRGAST